MQGKGFIKFFLVAFAVVSVIQLLFMFPTWNVERKADNFACREFVVQTGCRIVAGMAVCQKQRIGFEQDRLTQDLRMRKLDRTGIACTFENIDQAAR